MSMQPWEASCQFTLWVSRICHSQAELRCTRLEEDLSSAEHQAASVQTELDRTLEQLQASFQAHAGLQSSADAMATDLAAQQQAVVALQQDKQDLHRQLQEAAHGRAELQGKADATAAELAIQQQACSDLQQEQRGLESQLAGARAEAGSAHAGVAELQTQLAEVEAAASRSASEAAAQAEQLQSSLETSGQLHQELAEKLAGRERQLLAAEQVSPRSAPFCAPSIACCGAAGRHALYTACACHSAGYGVLMSRTLLMVRQQPFCTAQPNQADPVTSSWSRQ